MVFAVLTVLYHVAAVPLSVIDSAELAVKPYPVIGTTVFGLTAVNDTVTFGCTVSVAVAYAVPAEMVIVCAPPAMFVPVSELVSVTYSKIPPSTFVCEQPIDAALKGAPSNVTEMACVIGKPEPVMLIGSAEPATTPEAGDILADAIVVVTVAEAVLNAESVAEMTWDPGRNVGTVNVAIICPLVNVAVAATVILSIVNAVRATPGAFAKPEPTIVTVVPTAAVLGLTMVIAGAPVFVKVVEPAILAVVIT